MNKHVGERLVFITKPREGGCEGDSMILEFESICDMAVDHSEPGQGGCPSIDWESI